MEQNIKNSIQSAASRSPKNSFLVLISCLVVVLASTFLVYSIIQSRQTGGNKSNVAQNSTTDKVTNNQTTNQPVAITNNSVSGNTFNGNDDNNFQPYSNPVCGYSVQLPKDWIVEDQTTPSGRAIAAHFFMSSQFVKERDSAKKQGNIFEAWPNIIVKCYKNEKDFAYDFWSPITSNPIASSDDQPFTAPTTIIATIEKIKELKRSANLTINIKSWAEEIQSTEQKNYGSNTYDFIELGGFGLTCKAILNNNKSVIEIEITAGSHQCQSFPTEEEFILNSLKID